MVDLVRKGSKGNFWVSKCKISCLYCIKLVHLLVKIGWFNDIKMTCGAHLGHNSFSLYRG